MIKLLIIAWLLVIGASAAYSQPTKQPRVAWVLIGTETSSATGLDAFRGGLASLGFEDGRNVRLVLR